jgi:protein farnesyltransferase subunit beta
MEDFAGLWFDCESDDESITAMEQCTCERQCSSFLAPFSVYTTKELEKFREGGLINEENQIRLLRRMHSLYLVNGLVNLSSGFVSLDASRPWLCYWILHALYLLDKEPTYLYDRIVSTLAYMQNIDGGFSGGPQQLSHGAPNYAAVLALCTVGTPEAFQSINREAMYVFFLRMKQPCGGFAMHYDGETDTRSTYTILSIARILNILTTELTTGVAEYVISCQTYEGGFGGEPYNEAHGGYNFCSLACLLILGKGSLSLDCKPHNIRL